jgi:opacity protein-like surface antigen
VQGLSGYRIGILTGIPMGRFRLRVGTGFTKTEVDFRSVQLDSTGQTRSMDVQINNQNPAFLGAKGSSTNQTLSSINLQLIDLNVALYHSLGKRFGAALGGSVQYLQGIQLGGQYFKGSLFESADKQDKAAPVTSQNGGSTSTPIMPESSSLTKTSFRSLGIALQGEVSYQLAPRWSTSLGYRYSTRGFTKSSDLVLKPNWLELGVRFRMK